MIDSTVHIFWDNSNLFHRAQATADDPKKGTGFEPGHKFDLRLSFQNVLDFAAARRTIAQATAAGSVPPGLAALWEQLGKAGVLIELQERGAESGKEQGVDQALQLAMMNTVLDNDDPAVAVVLTGDHGFLPSIERMLKRGWGVEVLSFSNGFSPQLKKIATGHGGRGRYVELHPWYEQLTYLQDPAGKILRKPKALRLGTCPKV
jgi:uncharacterized LabA/DUF88 family protein